MNEIWANRLVAGTKTWAMMPISRREAVKAILCARVEDHQITEDEYEAITGEEYPAAIQ